MDILKIIEDAIYYPVNDLRGWGLIAAIFFVIGVLQELSYYYPDFALLFLILGFIVSIFLLGVNLTIIKETIDGGYQIPMIYPVKNFIDGVKNLIVNAVYYIIPSIIIFVIAILSGLFSNFEKFVLSLNTTNLSNATATQILSTVPSGLTQSLFTSIAIVAIFTIILFILFALFLVIAQARLADTGDIVDAINIKAVFDKISRIGWANYILFIILLLLLIFFIGIVSGFVSMIPYIGRIIASVLLGSYSLIVSSRAVGLMYREAN